MKNKRRLKKAIIYIHLTLGLITGLVVIVEGLTGAIYVFYGEIAELAYKDRRHVSVDEDSKHLPLSFLIDEAKQATNKDIDPIRVYFENRPTSPIVLEFQDIDQEALTYANYMKFYHTVYINPYTAEVKLIENSKWEFFNVILWLHMTLLLGYKLGGAIVTWSVVGFAITLISGLILWWPKNSKTRKKRLWFVWKKKYSWKRRNFDLHTLLGFYALIFALIISITGLFWALPPLAKGMKWIANGAKEVPYRWEENHKAIELPYQSPLDNIKHFLDSTSTDAYAHVIKYPRRPKQGFSARAYISKDVIHDRINFYFDKETGQFSGWDDFDMLTNGDKIAALNYDIHVGAIGYLPTKILAFITCLVITSLPITGFLIWRNKSYKV